MVKKRFATVWLDGCSGCHMSFLDMDEKILEILEYFDIVYSPIVDFKEFPEEVFITLVEGAVSSVDDLDKIKKIRKKSSYLVSIGDCAITRNVTSMRNSFKLADVLDCGYLKNTDIHTELDKENVPKLLEKVFPVHEVVNVDYFLPGCPPPADAFYQFIKSIIENKPFESTQYTRFGK
ncbi:MAG: NADP oxidoreductase [Deferribacterales bacterium]